MKICLITEYFYPDNTGGSPTGLSELSRYLKDHYDDIEIDVITSCNCYRLNADRLPVFEDWNGVKIHRVSCPRSNRPSTALRLLAGMCFTFAAYRKLLSMGGYDLVFVGTNPPSVPAAALAYRRRTNTPFVYLIHDLYPDLAFALGAVGSQGLMTKFGRNYQRKWLHAADRITVLGRCMKAHLERSYAVSGDKIDVVTNWADAEQIRPMPKPAEFLNKHKLNGFVALYAGNLGPFQGLDVILDAAQMLKDTASDVMFALVGNGARWDEIATRIEQDNLTNIRLIPSVSPDNYPSLLAAADVCLVPLAAGMNGLAVPSKFYTILAAGKPTIAILDPSSELSRVVNEYECGIRVDGDDPSQLADAVMKLRDSGDLAAQMGRNARATLEEHYTIGHIADRFYAIFSQVASKKGNVRCNT